MFFRCIVYLSAFILCIQALPVEEHPNTKTEFKGFKNLGSWKRNRPGGAIVESTYYLSENIASWSYGIFACYAGMSIPLLAIEDEAEDMYIRDLLFAEGLTGGVWSSGNYVAENEEGASGWMWDLYPYPVTYFNFKAPPTNSSNYNILPNGTPGNYGWSTANGALSFKYICERNTMRKEN